MENKFMMSSICGATSEEAPTTESATTTIPTAVNSGKIDYETFVKHAKNFIVLSDNLYDTWILQEHGQDQIYLIKHQLTSDSKYET